MSAFRWLTIDAALRANDFRHQLAHLQTLTDLIWGDHDLLQPAARGEALAKLLPNAHLHVVPNTGHNLQQEQPDEIARIIVDRVDTKSAICPQMNTD